MQTCKNVNSICQETFLGFVQWKKIALLYFKPKNKKVYFWQLAGAFLKERSERLLQIVPRYVNS